MWEFLVLLCLFSGCYRLSEGFSSSTYIGKYLRGHQLKVVQVEDWLGCIKHCQDEPLCISYNFDTMGELTCQLNRHGVEDHCQAEQELSSCTGWIFHQIREVTKETNRIERKGSCPCNCGTPNQCYIKPGFGDVPEKAAKSCQEILDRRGPVPDGAYYLKVKGSESMLVYCKMTSLPGCGDEGGWTLVMKINGSKTTFRYGSQYWNNPAVKDYQPENGANFDEKETKLATFSSITFTKMCMGMKTGNSSIHWMMKERSRGTTMTSLFMNPNHESFGYNRTTWLSLLPGSALDDGEIKEGFNVKPSSGDGVHVRIGAMAYQTSGGKSVPTSFIGFGSGGDSSGKFTGISCGNVRDNNLFPAFGYILVK